MNGKSNIGLKIIAFGFVAAMAVTLLPGCEDEFRETIVYVNEMEGSTGLDGTTAGAPVPGNGGMLSLTDRTFDTIDLEWTKASDDVTPQADLEYRVYLSGSNNIRTVKEIDAHEGDITLVNDWTRDLTGTHITALTPGTLYYFNVVVRDGSGNRAVYNCMSASTISQYAVFMYSTDKMTGNLMLSGMTARESADERCRQAKDAGYSDLPGENTRAFISVSADDDIALMPDNYGIPLDAPVKGPGPAYYRIAGTWEDLFSGNAINYTLLGAHVALYDWWSGSDALGNFLSDTSCNGWTDDTNAYDGTYGKKNKTDSEWISCGGTNCNTKQSILCVNW
jgi:hypothetical protein